MNNSLHNTLEDITTIDLTRYNQQLTSEIDRQKSESTEWDVLYADCATYDFLSTQINKYPLKDAKEFVDYCNIILSKKTFTLRDYSRFGEVKKLNLCLSNSKEQLIYNGWEPMVWGLEDPIINKYGFFKTSNSLNNDIEGIYVESISKKSKIPLRSFIMTEECSKALLPEYN